MAEKDHEQDHDHEQEGALAGLAIRLTGAATIILLPGQWSLPSAKENRLTVFRADNSCRRAWARQEIFFMLSYFWVCLGGAIGSGARFWVSGLVAARVGQTFPFGTLAVNVSGCFLVGLLAGMSIPEGRWMLAPGAREFLMIGLCGGYTTFSSFSLQTLALAQEGEWLRAAANSILSFVLCLVAVWLGHLLISFTNKA